MADKGGISVAVIEPVEVVRSGLEHLLKLSEGFTQVFSEPSVEAFLAWEQQGATILIMHHPLEGENGCGLALVHAHFEHLRILAFAYKASPAGMRCAARSGACGYLPMTASSKETTAALDDVRKRGHSFYAPFLITCVGGTVELPGLPLFDLTEQQMAILRLLSDPEEYSNHQIGDKLDLAVSTVETYRKHILKALGVRSSIAAVVKAIGLGLIDLPEPKK